MLQHLYTILTRNFLKHVGYTFFNILSLSIGMTCVVFIAFYVLDELSFDQLYPNSSQVYRVVNGQDARTPIPLGPTLKETFVEVEAATRFATSVGVWLFRYQDRVFNERMVLWAGASTFEVFGFPFLMGNPETALNNPYSVVINEDIARKYFGNENPVGKTIRADDSFDLTVTGVIETIPQQSHFQADILISMETRRSEYGQDITSSNTEWNDNSVYTYLLVQKTSSSVDLEKRIQEYTSTQLTDFVANGRLTLEPRLQSLDSIYLSSQLSNELKKNGNSLYLYMLTALGVGIVLISCVNFVNMSTARAMVRAMEVGIRKVLGAKRSQLVMQFLGETLVVTFFAILLTIVFVILLSPAYTSMTGKNPVTVLSHVGFWLTVVGVSAAVVVLSGVYPAFVMSAYSPKNMIKGEWSGGKTGLSLRKILVVIQFTVTIGFVIGALVIIKQLDYMYNVDLGFDKENIIVIPATIEPIQERYDLFKEALLQNPEVVSVTNSSTIPGRSDGVGSMWTESVHPEGYSKGQNVAISTYMIGYDFIKTLGFDLIAGRDFSVEIPTDKVEGFIFNESAIRKFGWEVSPDVIGRQIDLGTWRSGKVVGVVKDYHMSSLHKSIEPIMMIMTGEGYITVRVRTDDIVSSIDRITDQWEEINSEYPFSFSYLDEDFNSYYQKELLMGRLVGVYTIIAILISCIGLLGLVVFIIEKRRLEISVRKVLGASSLDIVSLLNRSLILVILIANSISWPVAYFVMLRWLQNFEYRIDLDFESFFLAGIGTFVVAILTVSYHSFQVSRINPVESLR